ncbi:MAG: hypothetical protein SF339_11195 [Blastocatellia bacterium]|nr:hypothetical protein [Blastocatellia bacterium]
MSLDRVKRTLLYLSGFAVLCGLVAVYPAWPISHAQQATTDDVSLQQLPVPTNVIGTYVSGASNDGKRLVFDSINDYNGRNVDSNTEIYVYDVETRAIIMITDTKDLTDADGKVTRRINNVTPVISGDGTKIAFVSNAALGGTTNDDGNTEIYLADLPRGATTATVTRITDTGKNSDTEVVNEIYTNYTPSISDNGGVISFVSTRKAFNSVAGGGSAFTALKEGATNLDPDGNAEIFLYDVAGRRYSQVTATRDADAIVNFTVRGFNSAPKLSGDGRTLAFVSGFNFPGANANKNTDFNGEIHLYKIGDTANTLTQVTDTTGTAIVPQLTVSGFYGIDPSAPMNLLPYGTQPLSRDGSLMVFESAGNYGGNNADKTRELWLYNVATKAYTRITNQTVSATPTQDELARIDYNMRPSINATGTHVVFASVLNLTPATTSSTKTDNADGSREVFRFDIAAAKFRQLSFSTLSGFVLDQRDAGVSPYVDDSGGLTTFSFDASQLAPLSTAIAEPFQALVRSVTTTNATEAKLANAASFDGTQVARGSIVAAFGTQLANGTASATTASLPYLLSGVSVTVDGIAAGLIFVSSGQINFVVPPGIANGDTVAFTINNNGILSSGKAKVVDAAPGVFSVDGSGKGVSTAQCGRVSADGLGFNITSPPCSVGNDSQADLLVIYGTGWRNGAGIQVKIGDQTLTPSFVGAQPDFQGLDQINVALTKELAEKKDLEITVTVPGTTPIDSNKTTTSFLAIEPALSVLNAASFETGFVARGSAAFAQGTELSNGTASAPSLDYPLELAGVRVTAAGVPVGISYVSPTQVNFVLPNTLTPAELVEVVVNNNGKISRGRVRVLDTSPGILTTTGNGEGRAIGQCYARNLTTGVVTFSEMPCGVGTDEVPVFLRVIGTGWRNSDTIRVKVGDFESDSAFFALRDPGSVGLDVVDVKVTTDLAGKADLDIIVKTVSKTVARDSKAGVKVSFK